MNRRHTVTVKEMNPGEVKIVDRHMNSVWIPVGDIDELRMDLLRAADVLWDEDFEYGEQRWIK